MNRFRWLASGTVALFGVLSCDGGRGHQVSADGGVQGSGHAGSAGAGNVTMTGQAGRSGSTGGDGVSAGASSGGMGSNPSGASGSAAGGAAGGGGAGGAAAGDAAGGGGAGGSAGRGAAGAGASGTGGVAGSSGGGAGATGGAAGPSPRLQLLPISVPYPQIAAVSQDGTVILGIDYSLSIPYGESFVWTEAGGTVLLPTFPDAHSSVPLVNKISGDGTSVFGLEMFSPRPNEFVPRRLFRWSAKGGYTWLAPVSVMVNGQISYVSPDGRTAWGGYQSPADPVRASRYFTWTDRDGFVDVERLPGWPAGGVPTSFAPGPSLLSSDARVVIGDVGSKTAGVVGSMTFRWSKDGGRTDIPPLPGLACRPTVLSADGSTVYGVCSEPGATTIAGMGYRWTAASGTVPIASGPGIITLTNADGSAAVGLDLTGRTLLRWTKTRDLERFKLPDEAFDPPVPVGLPAFVRYDIQLLALSDNGSTVNGQVNLVGKSSEDPRRPFRWSETGGFALLPHLGSATISTISSIVPDGKVAVGGSRGALNSPPSQPVVWDRGGVRAISSILTDAGVDMGATVTAAHYVWPTTDSMVKVLGSALDADRHGRLCFVWLPLRP